MGMRITPKGFKNSWRDGKFLSIWGLTTSAYCIGSPRRIVLLPRTTDVPSRSGACGYTAWRRRVIPPAGFAIVWRPSHNACASSVIRCSRDLLGARIPVRCIRTISTRSELRSLDCRLNIGCCLVMDRPQRFVKSWTIIPSRRIIEEHPMNFDQRSEEQQIRSGELPVVTEPSEDHSNLSPDGEFEETPFSKWILPLGLFVVTIFTTLWAGAYQVYNGP